MPESVSGVDEILDGLRGAAANDFIHQKPYVPLADAEAAVHAAADARTQEIVEWLWADAPLREAYAREMLADEVARRFPNGGTDA